MIELKLKLAALRACGVRVSKLLGHRDIWCWRDDGGIRHGSRAEMLSFLGTQAERWLL